MTKRTRRKIDAALKAKIALEALREQATVPTWRSATRSTRTRFTPGRSSFWSRRRGLSTPGVGSDAEAGREREIEKLHAKIGQLTVERDFLARRSGR